MIKLFRKTNKWRIGIRYTERTIWVKVFTNVNSQMIIDVVEQAFNSFKATLISQYVDTRYPFFGEEFSRFVGEVNRDSTIQISKVADYSEFRKPLELADTYVLNIFGKLGSNQLEKILNFGVFNIANVIYGTEINSENWQNNLLRLNSIIMRVFKLELDSDSDEFVELINEAGLLELAIDGNLLFCAVKLEYLTRLLHIINNLSDKYGYSLSVNINSMENRTQSNM